MPVFAVTYRYADRSAEVAAVRPAHRAFLAEGFAAGEILASGPFADDDAPGALLIVSAASLEQAATLLDRDPFAAAHLIAERTIRPWTQVLGPWAPHAT